MAFILVHCHSVLYVFGRDFIVLCLSLQYHLRFNQPHVFAEMLRVAIKSLASLMIHVKVPSRHSTRLYINEINTREPALSSETKLTKSSPTNSKYPAT